MRLPSHDSDIVYRKFSTRASNLVHARMFVRIDEKTYVEFFELLLTGFCDLLERKHISAQSRVRTSQHFSSRLFGVAIPK